MDVPDALLAIGEVARAADVAPSTLRYYEEIGLVTPVTRVGGHRRYDEAAIRRMHVVAQCQRAGFSLDEIRRLLDDAGDWRDLAQRKLADLDRQIDVLRDAQRLVRGALVCDCTRLDSCGRAAHTADGICAEPSDTDGDGHALVDPGAQPSTSPERAVSVD